MRVQLSPCPCPQVYVRWDQEIVEGVVFTGELLGTVVPTLCTRARVAEACMPSSSGRTGMHSVHLQASHVCPRRLRMCAPAGVL